MACCIYTEGVRNVSECLKRFFENLVNNKTGLVLASQYTKEAIIPVYRIKVFLRTAADTIYLKSVF